MAELNLLGRENFLAWLKGVLKSEYAELLEDHEIFQAYLNDINFETPEYDTTYEVNGTDTRFGNPEVYCFCEYEIERD